MGLGVKKMLRQVIFLILVLALGVSSCQKRTTLDVDVEDKTSQLLSLLMKRMDFDIPISWDIEEVRQSTYAPSLENLGLVERGSRGLIGTTAEGQPIIIYHSLERYASNVDWKVLIDLASEAGEYPVQVSFPPLGKTTYQACYTNGVFINCEIIVIYGNLVSKLRVTTPDNFLSDLRVAFIDSILLNIDSRLSSID